MAEQETTPGAAARILLVEGDDAVAQAETTLLTDGGFQLKRAKSCREALDILNTELFDLVLLDLDQGGEPSGLEMCRQIKGNPAMGWMPVMFTTKKISKETVEKVFAAGGDEFLASPFHSDELIVRTKVLVRKGQEERWLVERARKLAEKIAERDDELDDLRRFAQDIVSSLSSALLVLDAEETILFANAPFLEAVRAERRNVIGRKLSEFVDHEKTAAAGRGLSLAVRGAIQSGQPSRLRRITGLLKANPERVSDVTLTAIDYGGVRQVLMVAEDVTEQALAEIEVGKERAKLNDMVNAMNAALCLIDRDCNIQWQNRTFGLWFGDSFGQPGLHAFQQQLRRDQTWIEQVFNRGQVLTLNWSVFTPHGQRRHFSNIIARIKAPGGSDASQALVLTQDVTEAETRVEQLSLLRELSQILQGTLDAERLQHVILLCVTTGHALGFNRAFLFTRNRHDNTLDAQMAVGPASREDAFRIWASLSSQGRTLHDLLTTLEKLPSKETMALYPLIRNLRFPMDDPSEIIVRTALEKKEQVVTDASKDQRVTQRFRGTFGCQEFVSVPLIVKGSVVGVILADNLYSGRAITDDHVKLLNLFASQAALAIENAETYLELQKSLDSLRAAQQEIVHTAKLATIGKMAAHVAHEIRNPLSTIGGFARAILKKPENVERVTKNANIISEESTRLENLLKSVMDFSRPSAPVPKMMDFNQIVEAAFRTLSEHLSLKNIHSNLDLDRSIPEVQIDENQIRQVLHNFIRNAADSMPQGGALVLKTAREDDYVSVTVTDTGTGIPQDVLDRLFDPFFTTKPDGTGLGLAVSKKIIDDHGGRIEVKTQVGKGTTFKVLLPMQMPVISSSVVQAAQISGLSDKVPMPAPPQPQEVKKG
ncbi:MAG TPA: ATP-binding protein [Planctomycetota bacterium]|nr:ATP-binding protein [Planctomycetota bacterium]